jgi:hypothetical protein
MIANAGLLSRIYECKSNNLSKEETFDELIDSFNLTLATEQDWLMRIIETHWEALNDIKVG